jgi:hypothetical protein
VRKGFFAKDEFRYDPARHVFFCPAGETLAPHHQGKLVATLACLVLIN